MREVSGPIIAIALTLVAVFVPLAFMIGPDGPVLQAVRDDHRDLDGDLGVQLADAVARACPRCCCKGHDEPKDWLTRAMDRVFGGFFKRFNKVFHRGSEAYGKGVTGVISRKASMLASTPCCSAATVLMRKRRAGRLRARAGQGVSDQLRAVAERRIARSHREGDPPDERTSRCKQPGVESAVAFPGLSVNGFTNSSSAGIVFVTLKPFKDRGDEGTVGGCDRRCAEPEVRARSRTRSSPCSRRRRCSASARSAASRCNWRIAARSAMRRSNEATQAFIKRAAQTPELGPTFSSYQINVPQLNVDLDRVKAKQLGVSGDGRVQHDAGLSRLAVRERLQPLRPRVSGARAGGCAVPCDAPTTSAAEDAQRERATWCRCRRS